MLIVFLNLGLVNCKLTDWDVHTFNLLVMVRKLKLLCILNFALQTRLHLLFLHTLYQRIHAFKVLHGQKLLVQL